MKKGLLIILAGPSGSGKGTVLGQIKKRIPSIYFSISVTTRKPRPGEEDGVNYYFKTNEEFEKMIQNNEFFEWQKVYDKYYGTPISSVENKREEGYDVVLEIDTQGALEVMKKCNDCVSIFLTPKTKEILFNRLSQRNTESKEEIQKRLEWATNEYKKIDSYDYIVINDDLNKCIEDLESIIKSEKLKTFRNKEIIKKLKVEENKDDSFRTN